MKIKTTQWSGALLVKSHYPLTFYEQFNSQNAISVMVIVFYTTQMPSGKLQGDFVAKRKGKSVSFDAMVKFFMHNYNIPTRNDIERLHARLDRIERLIVSGRPAKIRKPAGEKSSAKQSINTASDIVMDVIRRYKNGVGFSEIRMQTGFEEKKLRNIIFRLNKLGKIKRKSRGIYIDS